MFHILRASAKLTLLAGIMIIHHPDAKLCDTKISRILRFQKKKNTDKKDSEEDNLNTRFQKS